MTTKSSRTPTRLSKTTPKILKTEQKPNKTLSTLRFLHLYPNMMDLYGDSGNLQILKYRAEQRGIKVVIDRYTVGDLVPPDFATYDLIFLGGGSDQEQKIVARDILKYRSDLRQAYQSGVFFLAICGGFQLFGKYYKDSNDDLIKGLHFFDFYTESSTDKRKRCIGNIVVETYLPTLTPQAGNGAEPTRPSPIAPTQPASSSTIFSTHPSPDLSVAPTQPSPSSPDSTSAPIQLVGFENHGGQTNNIEHPFGRVLFGNGNTFQNSYEGLMTSNFIGTYLHGPLLSKNPDLADYILATCLRRQLLVPVKLEKLDDYFEHEARREMLAKLL